jgi:primosomal protein N' (replication factor Y)
MKEPCDSLLTAVQRVLKIAVPYPLRRSFDYLPPEGVEPTNLRPGVRVEVPFGKGDKIAIGYLLAVGESDCVDTIELKRAISILDAEPLISPEDFAIMLWASRYYHHPVGEVFASGFPVLLRQGGPAGVEKERLLCLTEAGRTTLAERRAPRQTQLLQALGEREAGFTLHELNALGWNWRPIAKAIIDKGFACLKETEAALPTRPCPPAPPKAAELTINGVGVAKFALPVRASLDTPSLNSTVSPVHHPHSLNPAQQNAVDAVSGTLGSYQAFLLEGVTGSGKTEVYLRLVERVLAHGEQTMILVPEINLTPQLEARFRARFAATMAVFHSGLAETARSRAWQGMQRGVASILLGTRSAVFTPLARPGLIILDEEHDTSFKQQESFRFSARDIAMMRARQLGIPILLGSATPSLESLANVLRGRYALLSLPERTGTAVHPAYHLIDIRNQRLNEGLSPALIAQIRATLARGEQALLFLNRRGFAPTLICHACGWVAECKRCDARLVIHSDERILRCHHCGHEQPLLRDCPNCQTADLRPLGLGTERVEQALAKLFPKAKTLRIDRDSTRRKGSLEAMLDQIQAGEVDILLGTQMLAKGHHFPNVTLVGILDVDGGLFSLDFRAGERTAQMIVQVAGRAGREERHGIVLLQTRQPGHPLLRTLIREGYPAFAAAALHERREAELPPYSHQALWRAEANDAQTPALLLTRLAEWAAAHSEVTALGPVPAPMHRQAGRYRQQLLLQSASRKPLHELVDHLIRHLPNLPEAKRVRWSVDIDPVDLY